MLLFDFSATFHSFYISPPSGLCFFGGESSRAWMEKGRRFGSAEEFRERKKGVLPLAVFLSFNERDVHPHCPNASNPYHKCGRYCLEKIPSVKGLLDGESSGGSWSSTECDRMERKGVTPTCPNASNMYHKCAEYCFEKIKQEDAIKEPGKSKGIFFTADKSSIITKCKHASNPYHRCDDFCLKNCNDNDHPKDGVKVNSPKERKKMEKNTEITSMNAHCKHASNPYHKCADYCFKNVKELHKFDGAQIKEKRGDLLKERKADRPVKEKGSVGASVTSPNHTDSSKGLSIHAGTVESDSVLVKEDKEEVSMIELLDSQPLRIDATDLFKEWAKYCSLQAIEDNEANKG